MGKKRINPLDFDARFSKAMVSIATNKKMQKKSNPTLCRLDRGQLVLPQILSVVHARGKNTCKGCNGVR